MPRLDQVYRYFVESGLAVYRLSAVGEISGVITGLPIARDACQESFFPRQQSTGFPPPRHYYYSVRLMVEWIAWKYQ